MALADAGLRRNRRLTLAVTAAVCLSACATSPRTDPLHKRLIRRGPAPGTSTAAVQPDPVPAESFEAVIAKIRELGARARPTAAHRTGPTIETTDARLAAALRSLEILPRASRHTAVATEYTRLGLLDSAFDHYRKAVKLDPAAGAAYDGMARIWRDWRLPHIALGDAQRAVYYAPWSSEAYNTLGTILLALGHRKEARAAYEWALRLDAGAVYALNNLCYLSLLEGNADGAIAQCRQALAVDAAFAPARHNLALGYAAAKQPEMAEQVLIEGGRPAVAYYNLGIIGLAQRDYGAALAAFQKACLTTPSSATACERATRLAAGKAFPKGAE